MIYSSIPGTTITINNDINPLHLEVFHRQN